MEPGFVKLSEALKTMRLRDRDGKPFPFDVTYRTFNSQTKKGGRLKRYLGAKYLPDRNPNLIHVDTIHNILDPIKDRKNPNHSFNRTVNIELDNGDIKSLRFDFIITINGKNVIY